MLQDKGRLVKASFDYEGLLLTFETNLKTIADEYESACGFEARLIDNGFASFRVFNGLFKGKVEKVVANPAGGWFIAKEFEDPRYKCVYDEDGHIRQDIKDSIDYYFVLPYNVDIKKLNGLKITDGVDLDYEYTIQVQDTRWPKEKFPQIICS